MRTNSPFMTRNHPNPPVAAMRLRFPTDSP